MDTETAQELFDLALWAKGSSPQVAIELLLQCARLDPDFHQQKTLVYILVGVGLLERPDSVAAIQEGGGRVSGANSCREGCLKIQVALRWRSDYMRRLSTAAYSIMCRNDQATCILPCSQEPRGCRKMCGERSKVSQAPLCSALDPKCSSGGLALRLSTLSWATPLLSSWAGAVSLLQQVRQAVLEEVLPMIDARTAEGLTTADTENLTRVGQWAQADFVRNGVANLATWEKFPRTAERLSGFVKAYAEDLPRGALELSMIAGGTHIKPHCGPTNHRLRLHLALVSLCWASHT